MLFLAVSNYQRKFFKVYDKKIIKGSLQTDQ